MLPVYFRTAPSDGSAAVGGRLSRDQPDADAIKMFVGQVPRHMNESDIRGMFEEFGPVHQINVLRDKVTGHSKGQSEVTDECMLSVVENQLVQFSPDNSHSPDPRELEWNQDSG